MRQSNVGEIVKTTGIGREHPQRLGQVVSIDLVTAFRAGFRAGANQHAVGHRMANDLCRVNNGPASAIVDLASNLVRGPAIFGGPMIRPAFRDLRVRHIHHGGERPQIRDDRDVLRSRRQGIES